MSSELDQQQILQDVHDPEAHRLKVDTGAVINFSGQMEVAIDATDDNIAIRNSNNSHELLINSDGSINVNADLITIETIKIEDTNGDPITTDSGSLNVKVTNFPTVQVVSAVSLPLPTGAVTEVTAASIDSKIPSNLTVTSNRLLIDGSGATQPVSGTVSVNNFPATQDVTQSTSPWVISGIVTANAGTNLNTSALALDSTVSGLLTNTQLRASPVPISGTVTSNQGTSPWVSNITQFGSSNIVTGTGTSGSGIPRVTVSNDSNILATQSGTWNINNISGTVSLPTGASTATNQTSGGQKTQIVDSSNNTITSTAIGITKRALDVGIVDGPQLDSYNRLRVANQDLIFGITFANSLNTPILNTSITGSATIVLVTNQAAARLSTTTSSSDSIIVQSKRYLRYNPGISHQILITGIIGSKKTNIRQRWGYFDANDGLFFEQTETDIAVVVRTSTSGSPVDTRVIQSNWNLDKLDGTGVSGMNLDTTKHNVYLIDFVWQGAGRIRFGVMYGQGIIYFHQILTSNVNTAPFMRSPSRPARAELTNLGTTASTTNMDIVCALALRETNDALFPPYTFSSSRGTSSINVTGTIKPLISIRPKLTFNSIANRIPIAPQIANIICGNQAVLVQIYLNPTLTGASFASVNANSATEFDIAATAVSGGTLLFETYIPGANETTVDLSNLEEIVILGLDISGGTADILTITATSLGGNTATYAAVNWNEFQ